MKLGFLDLVYLAAILLSSLASATVENNQQGVHVPRIRSRSELLQRQSFCNKVKHQLRLSKPSLKNRNDWQTEFADECNYVYSFFVKDMTVDERVDWVLASQGDVWAINMLKHPQQGLSEEGLKTLIHNLTQVISDDPKMTLDNKFNRVLFILGGALIQLKGGIRRLTVSDIEEFGVYFIYLTSWRDYNSMSNELFDYILEMYNNATEQYMAVAAQQYDDLQNGVKSSTLDALQYKGSMMNLVMENPNRIKVICRSAFKRYKNFHTLSTENLNKIRYLLPCAPPMECKRISADWVKANIDTLSMLPMFCNRNIKKFDMLCSRMKNLFKWANICGRNLAEMAVSGNSPLPFASVSDMKRFKQLFMCVPSTYVVGALKSVGCSLAKELAVTGRPEITKYSMQECIEIPANMHELNCSYIISEFGEMLSRMKGSFYYKMSTDAMCDQECVSYFKGLDRMPWVLKRLMTKKCYSTKNKVIDSASVDEMGSLVTNLSPEKFKEVDAADLARNINTIKNDMKKAASNDNRKKQAVVKEMGDKMIKSGQLSAIKDSKEIMREVSLNDLKASITNISSDLGTDDLALTDSQNKWVMKELKKGKDAGNFTVTEIRDMKSLVKGFLSSDIKKMAETQSANAEPQNLELAKALCEQNDWPLAPLEAINRDLIVGGLYAVNNSHPFLFFTDVDVSGLNCECLINLKGSELSQMAPEVCSSVCTKIGSCDRLRCMLPSHRREIQQACMSCMNLTSTVLTESDLNLLGPNLLSEFSMSEVQTRLTGAVLSLKVSELKGMCMRQEFINAITGILTSHFGSDGSAIDEITLRMLGSAIKLFPLEMQQQMDKTVIVSIAGEIMETLDPSEDSKMELLKCCEQSLPASDLNLLSDLIHDLMITIKEAVIYDMTQARKKRSTVAWTCTNMRLIGEAFTTVSNAEIIAMETEEFTDCLTDIGQLTKWNDTQKIVLLDKAISSLNSSVCNMTAEELIQLGTIAQVLSVEDLECLPLSDTDLVSALGGLTGWNSSSLAILSDDYLTSTSTGDLTNVSVTDVAMLGEIICGFNPANLSTIPEAVVAGSRVQLGRLSDCSIPQYTALKDLLQDPRNWSAADVTELNNLLIGLSNQDIQEISTNAIEGLTAAVIAKLPGTLLAAMTTDQFNSLTGAQVALVTDEQKQSLSQEQITLLADIIEGTTPNTGGDNGNNGDNGGGDDSSGAAEVVATMVWSMPLVLMLNLLKH